MDYGEKQFDGRHARTLRRELEDATKALKKVRDEYLSSDEKDRNAAINLNRARGNLLQIYEEVSAFLGQFELREQDVLGPILDRCEKVMIEVPLIPMVGHDSIKKTPTTYPVRNPQPLRGAMSAIDFDDIGRIERNGRESALSFGSERTDCPHGSFGNLVQTQAKANQEKRRQQEIEDGNFARKLEENEKEEIGKEVEEVNRTPLRSLESEEKGAFGLSRAEADFDSTRPKQKFSQRPKPTQTPERQFERL